MSKYAIVDLEMCKVPRCCRSDTYHWATETIQIGAALVDENLEIIDEFITYVHPQYGSIDNYIQNLTGITVFDVNNACNMNDALQKFVNWLPEDTICVSWSENDEKQIRHEITSKGIDIPRLNQLLDNWQDCQKTFATKMDTTRKYRLSEALVAADIMFDEHAHDGLVDAKNTALLFIKMKKEPILVLNKYYRKASEDVTRTVYTIGDIFSKINVAFA